jgi:hypothetical protein
VATYAYRCTGPCGLPYEFDHRGEAVCPVDGSGWLVRDYRAESVGVDFTSLRPNERDILREQAALTLPQPKDFASKQDPSGMTGLRDWQDKHQPARGNSKPAWPTDLLK